MCPCFTTGACVRTFLLFILNRPCLLSQKQVKIRGPRLYTLGPRVQPKPQTLNPKPQTPNPKPQTLNPQPAFPRQFQLKSKHLSLGRGLEFRV